jgi:alkylation response protein AidB-like acyl-CoA dehydrogenase
VDPLTCARVIEEVAAADSAAGWSLFNPLSWAFISARLPDEGAEALFGRHPHTVIAGPFHPPMPATPVDGGYRVTGRSPFASNCHDATWIASTVMGMRGTGSDDIVLTDAFVPTELTFPLVPERVSGSHYQGPLYRFTLMGALAATFPPIVLAIARQAINDVSTLAQGKMPFGSNTLLRERATAQVTLAQAEATLRSAHALLYNTLGEAWERTLAGELASLMYRTDLLLATVNANSSATKVAELMYSVAGTYGIYTRNPLERHFRDLQVLKQHGFASENLYETVGQVYLGLPPGFAPVML